MIAIAITPLNKSAMLVWDTFNDITIKLDIKATRFSNSHSTSVDPRLFATGWHDSLNNVARLEALHPFFSDGIASWETVFVKFGSLVGAPAHTGDC